MLKYINYMSEDEIKELQGIINLSEMPFEIDKDIFKTLSELKNKKGYIGLVIKKKDKIVGIFTARIEGKVMSGIEFIRLSEDKFYFAKKVLHIFDIIQKEINPDKLIFCIEQNNEYVQKLDKKYVYKYGYIVESEVVEDGYIDFVCVRG